jgi:transcriptional pleiotropic regulator of transition state genes
VNCLVQAGYIRKLDNLGRVVIPQEIRKKLGVSGDDSFEIFTENDLIVLKKYGARCIFCGSKEENTMFHGQYICMNCVKEIGEKLSNHVWFEGKL